MNMKLKENKFVTVFMGVIILLWVVFFVYLNKYWQSVEGLFTQGAKNEIQILELLYYRGSATVYVLILYFVLISATMLYSQYLMIKLMFDKTFKKDCFISFFILIIAIILSMFNILRVLFLVLILVAFTLNFIIYSVSKSNYTFGSGEIVYEQSGFSDEVSAKESLDLYIREREDFYNRRNFELFGEIIEEEMTFKIEIIVEKKISK